AEFLAQAVDRVLGRRAPQALGVDEVGRIGFVRIDEVRDADADQTETGAVRLPGKKIASGGEHLARKLGRTAERAGAGSQPKVYSLELQSYRRSGNVRSFEP